MLRTGTKQHILRKKGRVLTLFDRHFLGRWGHFQSIESAIQSPSLEENLAAVHEIRNSCKDSVVCVCVYVSLYVCIVVNVCVYMLEWLFKFTTVTGLLQDRLLFGIINVCARVPRVYRPCSEIGQVLFRVSLH